MRASDLLKLAAGNLRRRRTRTVLTVLGVVIGTASIVVMVSLGLGMNRSLVKSFQDSGSLTMITITNYGDGMGSGKKSAPQLTDKTIDNFSKIPHVKGTSPSLGVYVTAKSGPYEATYNIIGVSQAYLRELKLASGSPPAPGGELSLVYGNQVLNSFHRGKNWMKSYTVDPEKQTIFYSFPAPESSAASAGSGAASTPAGQGPGDSGASASSQPAPQKKFILKAAGIIEGGEDDYSQESNNCYTDIDSFKKLLKKIYKKDLVPSPARNKNGKPLRYYVYDEAYVFADHMDNVAAVQKEITDMGYSCYSNTEWLKQTQGTLRITQMVLGGIGAVSLLVAAIGIMNTMMMSIYERTKEIGVMKVLGCDMGDIRNMFLTESAMIGLLGGIAGIFLSFGISAIINFFTKKYGAEIMGFSGGGSLSLIPLWLLGFAVLFATLVGMISGYIPSVRAMRLSPLAAIRNE